MSQGPVPVIDFKEPWKQLKLPIPDRTYPGAAGLLDCGAVHCVPDLGTGIVISRVPDWKSALTV